jgi:hypothetical protein
LIPAAVRLRRATAALLILSVCATGCREHRQLDQATAVAQSGKATAAKLADYYQGLAAGTEAFRHQYQVRFDQPELPEPLKKQFDLNAQEFLDRKAVALEIGNLYAAFGKITTNKPDDVQTATTNLQTALTKLDGHPLRITLPTFHGGPQPVPDDQVQAAIKSILSDLNTLQQIRDVKREDPILAKIASDTTRFFEEEEPLYVSYSDFLIDQSYDQLKTLINAGLALPRKDIEASVPPFKVSASSTPTSADAKVNALAYAHVEQAELKSKAGADATDMDEALKTLIEGHRQLEDTLHPRAHTQ